MGRYRLEVGRGVGNDWDVPLAVEGELLFCGANGVAVWVAPGFAVTNPGIKVTIGFSFVGEQATNTNIKMAGSLALLNIRILKSVVQG